MFVGAISSGVVFDLVHLVVHQSLGCIKHVCAR